MSWKRRKIKGLISREKVLLGWEGEDQMKAWVRPTSGNSWEKKSRGDKERGVTRRTDFCRAENRDRLREGERHTASVIARG